MKYILLLLFSFTLQAQSLLLLFNDEVDSTTTLPSAVWAQDPTLQMFTGGVPTLGTELATNGDFSAWTGDNPDGWIVSGENASNYITEVSGKARIVSDGTAVTMYQFKASLNLYYLSSIEITTSVSGKLQYGDVGALKAISAIGVYHTVSKATGTASPYVKRDAACDITVDNASFKLLTNFTPPTNVTDYSGSATGTFLGSMETVQPGTNTTGIEKGFIFDGVNDYIAVACTTSTTNSTLSAWVNFSTTGSERYIFGTTTGYVTKSSSEVIQASSGTIYLDGQPYSGSAVTANTWHLITVTGITLSGTQLNIGASITPGSYFQGFIDKAGRYNGTLSANQVLKLYNDTKSRYGL